jgi:hypothetical protein
MRLSQTKIETLPDAGEPHSPTQSSLVRFSSRTFASNCLIMRLVHEARGDNVGLFARARTSASRR